MLLELTDTWCQHYPLIVNRSAFHYIPELNRWEIAVNPPRKASRGLISIHVHVKNASNAGLAVLLPSSCVFTMVNECNSSNIRQQHVQNISTQLRSDNITLHLVIWNLECIWLVYKLIWDTASCWICKLNSIRNIDLIFNNIRLGCEFINPWYQTALDSSYLKPDSILSWIYKLIWDQKASWAEFINSFEIRQHLELNL